MRKLAMGMMLSFLLCLGAFLRPTEGAVNINVNFISGYYGVPQPTAVVYERRLGSWQDVATLYFLSRLTGTSPDVIVGWRVGGTPWVSIVQRLNVPVSVFYVPYQDEDDYFRFHQGPPYGNAWGYWRNRSLALNDDAIRRRVVLLNTAHYYRIPVDQEIRDISGGRGSFEGVVRGHEGKKEGARPHFDEESNAHARWKESQGHGGHNDHGDQGHGEGHGHGND